MGQKVSPDTLYITSSDTGRFSKVCYLSHFPGNLQWSKFHLASPQPFENRPVFDEVMCGVLGLTFWPTLYMYVDFDCDRMAKRLATSLYRVINGSFAYSIITQSINHSKSKQRHIVSPGNQWRSCPLAARLGIQIWSLIAVPAGKICLFWWQHCIRSFAATKAEPQNV